MLTPLHSWQPGCVSVFETVTPILGGVGIGGVVGGSDGHEDDDDDDGGIGDDDGVGADLGSGDKDDGVSGDDDGGYGDGAGDNKQRPDLGICSNSTETFKHEKLHSTTMPHEYS
ncbi:hypothetical protein BsWGS_27454 [Bradybaena similaris]